MSKTVVSINPEQQMVPIVCYGGHVFRYGISVHRDEIKKHIPARKQKEYSKEFLEWFVNFHAKLLHMQLWEKFPPWMLPLLKERAEELHEGLKFPR